MHVYIFLFFPFIFSKNVSTSPLILIWFLFFHILQELEVGIQKMMKAFSVSLGQTGRERVRAAIEILVQNTRLGHIWQIHSLVLHWKNRKIAHASSFHGSDAAADWVGVIRGNFLLQYYFSPTSKQVLVHPFEAFFISAYRRKKAGKSCYKSRSIDIVEYLNKPT